MIIYLLSSLFCFLYDLQPGEMGKVIMVAISVSEGIIIDIPLILAGILETIRLTKETRSS